MSHNPTAVVQSEEQLILAGQRGEERALETLFGRCRRVLYRTARRMLDSPEEAEDAVQDGLLSAFRGLARFEGRSQFSTWLTRCVINAALIHQRSSRARPTVSLEGKSREDEQPVTERLVDFSPSPEEIYAGKELEKILQQNLLELSSLLRAVVVLRTVEGYSTGEAAKKLGVTEQRIKGQLWRARRQLADRLGPRLCLNRVRGDRDKERVPRPT